MKRGSAFVLLLLSWTLALEAHGNRPGKSELALSGETIVIEYTAPNLQGRDIDEMLSGPRANPWRLGADRATKLITPIALDFGDDTLAAGEYVLRAFRDEDNNWWLQALQQSSREVVASLPLKRETVAASEDYMVIQLSGQGSNAVFKVQWGKQVLSGAFSAAD